MSLGQPTPPSPSAAISSATQAATSQMPFNVAAQKGSMINQVGPTGELGYTTVIGPNGVPITTATTSLTPAQQTLLNQMQGTQATAGGQAGALLSGANYGAESPSQAIGNMTSGLVGQMMNQELGFLTPFFNTQTSQLDAQLKNQGLEPGTLAYDNAMRANKTSQGLQVNQFLASAMPQEQQIAAQQYQMPMTMAESLGSFGAPASPTTGFTSALPGLAAPNTSADLTAMTQAQQAQYQAQQNQYNAMISALGGFGGAVMGGPVGSAIGNKLGSALAGGSAPTLY